MYVIKTTREFYGPSKQTTLLSDYNGTALRFATTKEAKARIEQLDEDVYRLSHNESSRPVYRVARVDSLPQYLTYCL